MAGKPADEDHPFGHGRMEYVSGLVVSILILMMGVELFKTSVEKVVSSRGDHRTMDFLCNISDLDRIKILDDICLTKESDGEFTLKR